MEINDSFLLESSAPYVENYCYNNCITIVTVLYVDGKNINVKLRTSIKSYPEHWTTLEEKVYVKLYYTSPSYYFYRATRYNYLEHGGNPFAERAPIFSNVEGGYGVLASLVQAIRNSERLSFKTGINNKKRALYENTCSIASWDLAGV